MSWLLVLGAYLYNMRRIVPAVLFLAAVLFSCKKDHDEEFPVIVWNSPANGTHANVFDTLHLSLHVSDNAGLENLAVKLLDANQISVGVSASQALSGHAQDVTLDLPISNASLESGNYYLDAEVYDGHNLARSYIYISITAVPKQFKGFFAATLPLANALKIYKTDTSWIPVLFSSPQSDFLDMEVSSYWQQVYSNGSLTGDLIATSIDGSTAGWSIHNIVNTNPYWGPMSISGSHLWVTYRSDDKIKSLDETGLSRASLNGDGGYYPIRTLQVGDKVFSEQKDITSSAEKLVVNNSNGPALQETILGINVISLFEKDANDIYVIGNNAGQGHLEMYDYTTNGMWEPILLPVGTVTSAAQVDSNTILIAMNTGTVYKFTYTPVGLLAWTNGINPTQLRYNSVDGEVLSAEGTDVKIYNYNPFSLTRTIAMPDTVRDLEVWYNR